MPQDRPAGRPVPVVYTMGKVGSTAIAAALHRAGLDCYHIHSLTPKQLVTQASQYLTRGKLPPLHVSAAMAFRRGLWTQPGRCLYISAVRDPLSRNLSAYFENVKAQEGEPWNEKGAARHFADFVANYPPGLPLSWFDREFKAQLGIDIYKHDFDRERRWSYYPEHRTVLFRIDCPDTVKSRVLSDLLGCEITIERENDSAGKDYVELYRQVQDLARFTGGFSADAYASRFCRHFWSKDELAAMAARWHRPEAAAAPAVTAAP